MKKRVGLRRTVILLILVVLLTACSGSKEPATIKVVFLPYLSNAPFFIAQEEGYFEEQGLTIELVEMTRSAESIPALEQGDVDVVGGALSAGLLNAIYRGANLKLVADKGQIASEGCDTMLYMAGNAFLEAHPSISPADLKGAKIGTNPASYIGYMLDLYLNQAGLSMDDVEIVSGRTPEFFEAIQAGTLDLTGVSEPWGTRITQGGFGDIWFDGMNIVPGASYAQVWFGPSLLGENSDVGNRFMVAYLKGVRQYNQGKTDRNVEILVKYAELEQELVRDSCWVPISNDGQIDIDSVFDFQQWALEKELLDDIVTEEQFWDPRFIEFAVKELGD